MRFRKAEAGNWQARGQEFAVGQSVVLIQGGDTDVGRVSAVYPAIGMVDVQFPHASSRFPVEDLSILSEDTACLTPEHENVPGGAGQEGFVSDGMDYPDSRIDFKSLDTKLMTQRVALATLKRALYWNGVDRKYKCSIQEDQTGQLRCPKSNCDGILKKTVYKRVDGISVRLLGCPNCMFLIREQDIVRTTCGDDI